MTGLEEKQLKDTIKVVGEKEVEKKLKLLGSIRPKKGHTLFEINLKTLEMREAETEIQPVVFREGQSKFVPLRKKVVVKVGHTYISALNKKNALKHLAKRIINSKN